MTAFYALLVDAGWSGAVVPDAANYLFRPSRRVYAAVTDDIPGQNFAAQRTAVSGNHRPQAIADTVVGLEDTPTTITLGGYDEDGDPLTFVILTLPEFGVLYDTVAERAIADHDLPHALDGPEGRLAYDPDNDYNAPDDPDAFVFEVSDGRETSAPAELRIAVRAVNDPPSFAVPADLDLPTGETTSVPLTEINPGAPDETWQTLTFAAHSNNQQILPNAALVFVGSELLVTPHGGGPVTITLLAKDDGGTDDGGIDLSAPVQLQIVVAEPRPPIAEAQQIIVHTDTSRPIVLMGRDGADQSSMSPLCQPLEFTLISQPRHGRVVR